MVGGKWRPDPQADVPVNVEFNYRTDFNEGWDDPQLKQRWNYVAVYPAGDTEGLVVDLTV